MPYRRTYRKKKPSLKLRRRGFAASFGGYGFKAGIRWDKRSLSSKVTDIVRKNLETPHHFINNDINTSCLASTHYTYNLLSNMTQGDSNDDRTGDIIHIDTIKFRNLFISDDNTPHREVFWRFMIVKSREAYTGPTWTSGLGNSDLYVNSSTSFPTIYGIIDPKRVTVLFDKTFKTNKSYDTQTTYSLQEFNLPMDQKFVFDTDQVTGKNVNLYAVVIPYFHTSVSGTDTCGSVILNTDIIFKNCK